LIEENINDPGFNSLKRISNYIDMFDFPRLPGTEGEKRAIDLTVKIFNEIGFENEQVIKESFKFSNFYSSILIKLLIVFSFTIVFSLLLMVYISHFSLFLVIVISIFVILLIVKDNKHPEETTFWNRHFGKYLSSSNVYVKIPNLKTESESRGDIILSAHIDSKSQPFTSYWRGKIYRTWIYCGFLFGSFYTLYTMYLYSSYSVIGILLFSNMPRIIVIEISLWFLFFLILISNILLLMLKSHNKSTGAIDNASGMAIVFELSAIFKDTPLNNYNLWFCQFSAEEMGTMGSRFFLKNHEDKFSKGKVFLINSDAISDALDENKTRVEYIKTTKRFPRRFGSPTISKYLELAAKEEGLLIHGFHSTFGIHFDSLPFRLRGYDAIDIHTKSTKRYTHNKVDSPDKINPKTLHNAVVIIRKAVVMLDNDYKNIDN
jgi:hypothetical protein